MLPNNPNRTISALRDWEDAKKGWYGRMGVLAKHNIYITTKPNSSHRNASDKATASTASVCGMTPISILPGAEVRVGQVCSLLLSD